MTITNSAKESGARRVRSRRTMRVGAAASGLAVVLMCGATGTALGAPNEPRQVHVEGQLLPWLGSPVFIGSPVGWSAPATLGVSG
jgi:hypothetical protein